jgi:hypothetical protein
MAVRTAQVTVTTSATALQSAADSADSTPGNSVSLYNTGATDAYVGGSGVTSSTGFLLKAGAVLSFDLGSADVPYGITASGTTTVHVLSVK